MSLLASKERTAATALRSEARRLERLADDLERTATIAEQAAAEMLTDDLDEVTS
ncbi:hypothetical protein [Gordonia hankookensis]|uniref:Uncharacterized protein n=1 Tax=Gordonia hankookensis TaxID=589403 RepID=A0ABR7W7N9_9ACTN|nr:hypothetical protein [Gordonia hankookensis]MBD1318526.1 hypothetical protein [Gordonia hankookensis]